MLKTILGDLEITVNDQRIEYLPIQLDNQEDNFLVDGRYKIIVNLEEVIDRNDKDIVVISRLVKNSDDDIEECIESDERLAMLSFYQGKNKVSIGVEDELTGVFCTYEKESVKIIVSSEAKISDIVFGIAWITWSDYERQEIYTCFAADPTMYKAYENIRRKNDS